MRFGDKDWRHQIHKTAQDWKFRATLKPRLDRAVEDWHATQPPNIPEPLMSEFELRITASWEKDDEPGSDHS